MVELHRHLAPRVRARKHLRERGVIDVQLVPARLHPTGYQADFADDAVGAIHARRGERGVKLAPGGVREFNERGFCGHAPRPVSNHGVEAGGISNADPGPAARRGSRSRVPYSISGPAVRVSEIPACHSSLYRLDRCRINQPPMNILRRILLAVTSFFVLAQTTQAHYDPNIGRWISRDPIGEEGGPNMYAFVDNRPTGAIDRFGLQPITAPPPTTVPMPVPGIPGTPDGPPLPVSRPPSPFGVGAGIFFLLTGTLNSGEDDFARSQADYEDHVRKATGKREDCGCCECVTSLGISDVQTITPGFLQHGNYGHRFTVQIGVERHKDPLGGGQAYLSWKERTNKPTYGEGTIQADQWNDLASFRPGSPIFAPWYLRQPICPGSDVIKITDSASAPEHEMPRYVDFKITVYSGCDSCPIKSLTINARQELNPRPHFWSNPVLSFK